jgi:D-inositol-3-phosphate glycosyltransferase
MYQTSKSKGQELVAQRMVREFNALGHKAYLITSVFNDGEEVVLTENLRKIGGHILTEDTELGIPVIRVDSYLAKWPPRRVAFRDFISNLERIVEKYQLDILITHSTLWNGPEEVAKFIEWRRYMKNVGGYQDPLVFCHMSHFQEPSPKRYSLTERSYRVTWNKLILPQILSTANLILVVTPDEKMAKIKMGAKAEKCFLFPGGVDDANFLRYANLNPNELRDKLKLSEETKIVSYLGSLEERKNPAAILKIATLLKDRHDIHFVLAGRGDSSYAREVIEGAKALPNVTYLGEVSEQEKVLLIKASYANLILSRLEALGLSQLEFMYWGVPVITSAVGGQSWIVRDGKEGIHVKGADDVKGAASVITRLVDNPADWSKLSAKAKERAMSLTMSKIVGELNQALTLELMKERGLIDVPVEARTTMIEPENVLKSWSQGSWGVVATARRIFIKRGMISRKITEIPYAKISSIEYTRRYSWKTLVAGGLFSLFFLVEPSLEPIFSRAFMARLEFLVSFFQIPEVAAFVSYLPAIPIIVALLLFVWQARIGFTLQSPGLKPIYLPPRFREVIAFVRSAQDGKLKQNISIVSETEERLQSETAD